MKELRKKLARVPTEPGVYLMKDAAGTVLYVGKAANLRSRVRSYFQNSADLHPRTRQMLEEVAEFDFVVTDSETEALILEFNLIQQHRPRYNVRFRDDKRYPFIRIPVNDPYPPIMVVRRPAADGARYFGPYVSTRAMRQTIRLLRRLFGLRYARGDTKRTCSGHPWDPLGPKRRRPCLDHFIGICLAPCADNTATEKEYAGAVKSTIDFLEGRTEFLLRRLHTEMEQASEQLRYESAARLRDHIAAVEAISDKQRVLSEKKEDLDVIAAVMEQDMACVVVLQIREGRLIGQNQFFLEGITGLEEGAVLTAFVKSYYLWPASVPSHVILSSEIEEREAVTSLLAEKKGQRIKLLVPQKGEKRRLIELALKNAQHYLQEALDREETSRKRAEEALLELKGVLDLAVLPSRIECYDISNLFGYQAVGSMVVFENGRPKKSNYRRFRIRTKEGQPDDFAMMREVLSRRLRAGLEGSDRFKQLPNLILVDGGKGQLNVALQLLQELKIEIPAAGLAKQFEHIFIPGRSDPIALPRHSRSLHLLQALRDEAHRFAVAYHRTLRGKEAVNSILQSIPGIGPKRQQTLLSHFPSLEAIRQAGVEEVAKLPGIGRAAAEILLTNLRAQEADLSQEESG